MKQQKSKSGLRILRRRTPKGRTVVHYAKKKPNKAICARCSAILQGVPKAIPSELRAMARTERGVSRRFGGVLCGNCLIELEKYKMRMEGGYIVKRDLTIEKFLPRGWYASLNLKAAETSVKEAGEAAPKKTKAKQAKEKAEDTAEESDKPKEQKKKK